MKPFVPLLALLTGLCCSTLGQDLPSAERAQQKSIPARFDFDFPGGTLDQLLEDLSSVSGAKANVVLVYGAGKADAPKLKLYGVTSGDVLNSLASMDPQLTGVRWRGNGAPPGSPGLIWTVTWGEPPTSAVHVAYIGDLLKKYTIDDITAAISFALDTANSKNPPPKLRLHKETSLLIVEGSDRDIGVAAQVIAGLRDAEHLK